MWKMFDENSESHQKSMGSDDDYVSDLELCIRFQIIRLDWKKKKEKKYCDWEDIYIDNSRFLDVYLNNKLI